MFDPEIVLGIVSKAIKKNEVFGDLLSPQSIASLAKDSLVRFVETGHILCQQNQYDSTLFLLIDGEAEVSTETNHLKTSLGKLGAGELIGEIAALFQIPRIATVTVTRPSVVLEIPADVFSELLSQNQLLRDAVNKRSRTRVIETSLRCIPIFDGIGIQPFSELCYLSSLIKVNKHAVVVHEGAMEKSMYVICSGTARVYITVDGQEINIAMLRPGDFFGEYSFLTGEARSASVSAATDLQLVLLEGETFHSFLEYYDDVEGQIEMNMAKRKQSLNLLHDSLAARQTAEMRFKHFQEANIKRH